MEQEERWWSVSSPNNVCHYTTAEALLNILNESQLRLGPFRHSNDPYEFESWIPSAIMGGGPRDNADMTLSRLIAMHARLNRVAFATDDDEGPPNYVGHDVGHRGFGSLPMWAHYGDRFRGACLVFDREKLVQAVIEQLQVSSDAIFSANGNQNAASSWPSSTLTAPTCGASALATRITTSTAGALPSMRRATPF
jgi:hypothetical protein